MSKKDPDIFALGKAICETCSPDVPNATCSVCKLHEWGDRVSSGENGLEAHDTTCSECREDERRECSYCRLNELRKISEHLIGGKTIEEAFSLTKAEELIKRRSSSSIPVYGFAARRR